MTCPGCNRPFVRRRGQIGVLTADICDVCYYERFAGHPSEDSYFASDPEFWRRIEAEGVARKS